MEFPLRGRAGLGERAGGLRGERLGPSKWQEGKSSLSTPAHHLSLSPRTSSCARPGRSHLNSSSSPSVASAPAGPRRSGRHGVRQKCYLERGPRTPGRSRAAPPLVGRQLGDPGARGQRFVEVGVGAAPSVLARRPGCVLRQVRALPINRPSSATLSRLALLPASSPRDGPSPEEHRRLEGEALTPPRRGGGCARAERGSARAEGLGGRGARCPRCRRPGACLRGRGRAGHVRQPGRAGGQSPAASSHISSP